MLALAGLLIVSAPGCRSEAENFIRQTISDTDALSDAIERRESPEKIKAAAERLRASVAKDVKMEDSERARLEEKYAQQMTGAVKRLVEAKAKNPEGAAAAGWN